VTLSTTVDATYGDDPANPSQKQHQQDHDVIHAAVNGLSGTYEVLGGASNRFRMRALTKKLASIDTTIGQVRWLTFGSSVADTKIREGLGAELTRAYGGRQAGAIINAYGTGGGSAGGPSTLTKTTTGTVTDRVADFDVWPSGLTTAYTTTGTATYGLGGGAPTCDNIEVYYITGPATTLDGGTFSYAVDGGAATNVSTLAGSAGIGRVTLTPTHGPHNLTLAWVSGNVRIVGVAFWDSTINGFLPLHVAQGGINLFDSQAQAFANFQTWLGWVTPDVITFEMKSTQIDASYASGATPNGTLPALKSWLNAVAGASTANAGPDVILIGSTPDASGTQQSQSNVDAAKIAATYQPGLNVVLWDGYTPLGSYANVLALGWQGDGTHLDWKAQRFLAMLLARDLALFDVPLRPSPKDVVALAATIISELYLGTNGDHGNVTLGTSGSLNVTLTCNGDLIFTGSNGELMRLALSGGGTTHLPNFAAIGSGNAFLKGVNASRLSSNIDWNTLGDFEARNYLLGANAFNGSGAITADLTSGALQLITLTGNVTSFAINQVSGDTSECEIHFIQDATGSRTLAGFAAAIKWAGGVAPAWSTTAGYRDIIRFRVLSGTFYEIARSIGVH
jgi:hypothetical protein